MSFSFDKLYNKFSTESPSDFARTLAFVVALTVLFLWWRRSRSPINLLPVPDSPEILFGHERLVFKSQPGVVFRKWIDTLGRTFRIKASFGARDIVVLADRDGIHHILNRKIFDYFHSDVVRPRIARLLGKGLGWVEGSVEHRRMKQVISPSLNTENIRAMFSDMRDAATRVIDDLDIHVSSTSQAVTLNILVWSSKMTLNVIGRVAFMHDFDGGNSPDAQLILSAKPKSAQPMSRFAGFIFLMLLRRFTFLNRLPIPAIMAQGSVREVIDKEVSKEIVKQNQDLVPDGKSLLYRLLRANLPVDEMFAHISTFIIAGHETTTLTLSYSLFELARHPDCQRRLREELGSVPSEPTYDDYANKLPYLDAVLKETLRLYPSLPYMERVATKRDIIPLRHPVTTQGGRTLTELVVEPGQTILIPIIAIHRMDAIWADPDEFRPERWLEPLPHVEDLPDGWANLLAFSDGPRKCIGYQFAIYNYKIIMTGMIKRFRFINSGVQLSLKIASSLQPWVLGREDEGTNLPITVEPL